MSVHFVEADNRRFAAALAFGLIFWGCYIAYAVHLGVIGNDFGVFHRAAAEPLGNVYALREQNPFAYPPTTLLWLQPLAWLGWNWGFALWAALSVAVMGWATLRLASLRIAWLVVASPALATTVVIGQFGALVGAMILFAVSLKGWRQGMLLGLAATIKPQILLIAPLVLLARRDWSALLGAGITGAATIMVSILFLGPELWLDWLRALAVFPDAVERAGANAASVSPAGVASNFHLFAWPFLEFGAGLAVLLLWKRARRADPIELAGLVIIGSVLMSPYLLVYDIVALMPFVVQRMLVPEGRTRMPALATFLSPFAGIGILWLTISLITRGKWRSTTGDNGRQPTASVPA